MMAARFVETCEALLDGFEGSGNLLARLRNALGISSTRATAAEVFRVVSLIRQGPFGSARAIAAIQRQRGTWLPDPLGLAFLVWKTSMMPAKMTSEPVRTAEEGTALTQTLDEQAPPTMRPTVATRLVQKT